MTMEENWNPKSTDLPMEIWNLIGKRLARLTDILNFRSVSKLLRTALPSVFPLRVPPPPNLTPRRDNHDFYLTEVNMCSIESNPGQRMLVAFQQDPLDGTKLHPNPILPPGFTCPGSISHQPSFLAKSYRLQQNYHTKWQKSVLVSPIDGDLRLAVISNLGKSISMLRIRSESSTLMTNWESTAKFCFPHFIVDIAAYKGQLIAVSYLGVAFAVDCDSMEVAQVAVAPESVTLPYSDCCLFESSAGELCMVACVNHDGIQVYSLSLGIGKWVKADREVCEKDIIMWGGFAIVVPRDALYDGCAKMDVDRMYYRSSCVVLRDDHKEFLHFKVGN